ncbi:MAG: peroxiredoxin [Candidatus Thorarchaeota archaeon]
MLKIGDTAPSFETTDEEGNQVDSDLLKGKKFVLYFYPRDSTPGCTKEACSIRDNYQIFQKQGIPIFGVSGGSEKSHQRFKEKNSLPFPLLMDQDLSLAKKYGVYKKPMRVTRVTFLIDEKGTIEGIFGGDHGIEKVNTSEHANQIINFWELSS